MLISLRVAKRVAKFDSIRTNQKLLIGKPSISARKVCFIRREAIETVISLSCSDYLYINMRATSFAMLRNTAKTNKCYDLANDLGDMREISGAAP